MKTMLRIGLILIGVLTIWVACFASERGQSLTKVPEPSVDLQSLTKALSGDRSLDVKWEADASAVSPVQTVSLVLLWRWDAWKVTLGRIK
ncbi:MAG: hypothetical protein WA765_04745 [Candidatus Acidiferrum sp.]